MRIAFIFLARDEGVGYVLESAQSSLFVLQFRLFPESDGLALLGSECTTLVQRTADVAGNTPKVCRARGQVGKRNARFTEQGGETDLGEVCGCGNADLGVGRAHLLLCRE